MDILLILGMVFFVAVAAIAARQAITPATRVRSTYTPLVVHKYARSE